MSTLQSFLHWGAWGEELTIGIAQNNGSKARMEFKVRVT